MKVPTPRTLDLDCLRRCKESPPEQKLDWLAAAVEFARAPKVRVDKRKKHPSAS
jgi:hypothetical protein